MIALYRLAQPGVYFDEQWFEMLAISDPEQLFEALLELMRVVLEKLLRKDVRLNLAVV